MSLAKPEDIDEPTDTDTVETYTDASDASHGDVVTNPAVTVMGDEMPVSEAVTLLFDMLESPEAFGMVSESRVEGIETHVGHLAERIESLEEQNERLRGDVAVLWEHVASDGPNGQKVIPNGDGTAYLPDSFAAYDPTAEFTE